MELGGLELALLVVGLVDGDDDRRRRAPQDPRGLQVGRRRPAHRVDDEQDDVRLGDRQPGLLLDPRLDRVVRVELQAAGVDDDEPPAVPLGVAVEAVAGRPGAILDDRRALAEEPVEERALADVRAADDGDDRDARRVRWPRVRPRRTAATGRRPRRRRSGSEVVRPAGVAARSSAAWASSAARALRLGRAGDLEDPLGDVAQVLDRRRRAAGDPDDRGPSRTRRVGQVADALDLDRGGPGDLAQAGQLLGVGARAAADDDHQVDLAGRLEGVLLAADRDRADGVDDLELVGARDHERGQLLELPGRLGGLGDEGHPLARAGWPPPILLLVDDDRVGGEAEQPDDLGMLRACRAGRSCSRPRRAGELALLLDHPGAGAVDDLEAALLGAFHDVRTDAVGADDDRRAVVDVVERLDGLDAEGLEVADDALVVDDLAEGMRRLAGGRRLLGLVDRLANAVAEAGALRDADFLDRSHVPIIARGPRRTPSTDRPPEVARRRVAGCAVDAALGRRQQRRDPLHDHGRHEALGGPPVRARREQRRRDGTGARRGPSRGRPGAGSFWPFGQTPVRAGDPDRHDRGAGPQGQQGDAVAGLLERAVGAARALREDEQDVALVEDPLGEPERLHVRRAAIDRMDAAVARRPSRRSASRTAPSCPASGSAGRASGSATTPSTTASRLEAWFAAMISGPSRGISSIAPSIAIRLIARREDPAAERQDRR